MNWIKFFEEKIQNYLTDFPCIILFFPVNIEFPDIFVVLLMIGTLAQNGCDAQKKDWRNRFHQLDYILQSGTKSSGLSIETPIYLMKRMAHTLFLKWARNCSSQLQNLV